MIQITRLFTLRRCEDLLQLRHYIGAASIVVTLPRFMEVTMVFSRFQVFHLYCLAFVLLAYLPFRAIGQGVVPEFLDSIVLYAGDQAFSSNTHVVRYNRKQMLSFEFNTSEQIVRGELFTKQSNISGLQLLAASDFDIIDSLEWVDNSYYRFRIRFKNLAETEFPTLKLSTSAKLGPRIWEVPLLAFTPTAAAFYPGQEDLYLGEVRKWELMTNNLDNLVLDGLWHSTENFDYRLLRTENKAHIFIEPKVLGEQSFTLNLTTKKPRLIERGESISVLPEIQHTFNVKNSRHIFLKMDVRTIVRDPRTRESTEVYIENNRRLQVGKTYRIEAAEEIGSPLIAELFTKRRLTNDKVICDFRPYTDHRVSDGYLFIKDGDTPVFMTNVDIERAPTVERVVVVRNGDESSTNLQVLPGETVEVRIEGRSLRRANFHFDELEVLTDDSLAQRDVARTYRVRIPVHVGRRTISIYEGDRKTGFNLSVKEHQRPRHLDFVLVDYGEGPKVVDELNQPILYGKTVNEVVISFNNDLIDQGEVIYGKQHIKVEARIEDKDGNLIETRNLGEFQICPGEDSPRAAFYGVSGCRPDDVYLNTYLSRKTHALGDWSRIELIIEHLPSAYSVQGYKKRVVIYNQRRIGFDVDVSIPAGLITQRLGQGENLSPLLSGIGFAMMAQFSFYRKEEIKRMLPIKAGLGFLAQNAFNFNPEADRDLGIIAIASVYPVNRRGKLSFPLFFGGGYFMQENTFFVMVGPGIRVSF